MIRPNFISPATPRAAQGDAQTIFSSATLAASGAWTRSSIVSVEGVRKITLLVDYDPAATSGYPVILPVGSCQVSEPAGGDDVWFRLPVWDGSVTAGALTGTLATGTDFTIAQNQGVTLVQALALRLASASADTNEFRQAIVLDVTPFRWFHFQVAEVGATGSPGTFSALYSLSA